MKKLVILALALVLNGNAFAASLEPQWSEFAPSEHLTDQPTSVAPYPNFLTRMSVPLTLGLTLPVFLIQEKKYYKTKSQSYWANRRLAYENELNQCRSQDGDKTSCFMQLRQIEAQKNQTYQTEESAREIRNSINNLSSSVAAQRRSSYDNNYTYNYNYTGRR